VGLLIETLLQVLLHRLGPHADLLSNHLLRQGVPVLGQKNCSQGRLFAVGLKLFGTRSGEHHLAAVVFDLIIDAFEVVALLLIGGRFVAAGRKRLDAGCQTNHCHNNDESGFHFLPPFVFGLMPFGTPAGAIIHGGAFRWVKPN
jgi:hypothetical protein